MTASAACVIDEVSLCSAATDTYDYDAFGNLISSTGTTPNNYLYRAEQWDPDLGLYYLRARYLNPLTGRFMSRDPEDGFIFVPRTLHKYLYVGGNPVNHVDRSGRAEGVEDAGANAESLNESIDNLESIEKAQARIRSGSDKGRIIDEIQKSLDRVTNELKKITSLEDVE